MTAKDENEKILNRRNTAAVEQSLSALSSKVYEQQARIDTLQATITSCIEKIAALEKTILLQRAAMAGHGPSVK